MYRKNRITLLMLICIFVTGCRVETESRDFVLKVDFAPTYHDHPSWAAAAAMVFDYHDRYYTQTDLIDFSRYYFGYTHPSIDDIGWLFWDLIGLDSDVTGSLTFRDIRSQLNRGNPVLLQYGDYYRGHFLVLHGYDSNGHVYIHEPGYGTRIIHYDDLYYRTFHGEGHYWESSLILLD